MAVPKTDESKRSASTVRGSVAYTLTLASDVQPANAFDISMRTLLGISIPVRLSHPSKADAAMLTTEEGMTNVPFSAV